MASGRTDAGVHARMQVLSLRIPVELPVDELTARLNEQLPPTVGIALTRAAPPHFNAHWRASAKEYRYRLALVDEPAWAPWAWRVDVRPKRLAEVLRRAVGPRDFSAFHARSSAVRERPLESIEVGEVQPGLVEVRLRGERFGRYMVRYLVGGAVAVASGRWSLEGFDAALAAGDGGQRPRELERAPAAGLVLWSVEYPPADDPFTAEERSGAHGVPRAPPFSFD